MSGSKMPYVTQNCMGAILLSNSNGQCSKCNNVIAQIIAGPYSNELLIFIPI